MSCHFIDFDSSKDATKLNIEALYPLLLIHMKTSHIYIKKKKLIKTTKYNINKKKECLNILSLYIIE